MTAKNHKFKTEISQLLNLVIHSLYSNKDIFLRELISNASDAIDRVRFEAISDQTLLNGDGDWKIQIIPNAEAKTLTIIDNGIGMNQEEVEANIGTIASSGTRRFLEEMKKANGPLPPELIGQFGVGFYSAFMVATKVELTTLRAGHPSDQAIHWESTGEGSYSIDSATKATRGTEIVLHLREEAEEYLDEWKIRKIVKKFSDFVEHPVMLQTKVKNADGLEEIKFETINSRRAIWQRPASEITAEEYTEFYKHISHDFQEPLETIHWSAEGTSEFKALLFIPKKTPFEMFNPESRKHGVQLYVRRVFITDHCEPLMPQYLRFLRGVVDSSDLPLNVSREMLQEDRQILKIRKNLVKKTLDTLKKMKEGSREKYLALWQEFGAMLKEGIHLDLENREKIEELLLFKTNKTAAGELISLQEYVDRMPEAQKHIYYISGENLTVLENSPHLEAFRAKGYEVVFFTDPIDEWVVQDMTSYKGKDLKPVDKGEPDLDSAEEKKAKEADQEKAAADYKELLETVKAKLGDRVRDVRLSQRLTDSACCLVGDQWDMGVQMEKIMRAFKQETGTMRRTLEVNPGHPALTVMRRLHAQDKTHPKIGEYAELLYDQALLTAGLPLQDPLAFSRRVSSLMAAEGNSLAKD
jgi:molecular chaperone HtpG